MPDARADRPPPNILLVMTDQQRYDSLASYGLRSGHTPHLDALAAEGARFERCYVANPICTPSRASLMTGRHLPGHGVYRLYDRLPDDQVTVSERLRALGYQTALVGKLHVSSIHEEAVRRHPHDGFDRYEWCVEASVRMDSPHQAYARWLEERAPDFAERLRSEGRGVLHHPAELHLSRWAAERTIAFLEERDPARPFFCMTSLFDPHNPYRDYPLEARAWLDEDALPEPLPPNDPDGEPEAHRRERRSSHVGDARDLSPEAVRAMRRDYHAKVAFADQEIGRVLARLDAMGLRDDTLVVFTSDHGDMLGDHGLLVKGAFSTRTCACRCCCAGPVASPPARAWGLVQLFDVAATMLDAAGADEAARRAWAPDARSLLPLACGETAEARPTAVGAYRNSGLAAGGYWDPPIHATMLRAGRFKLNVYHLGDDPDAPLEGELYDLEADPDEATNLWDDLGHLATRLGLLERLLAWEAAQERRLGSTGGVRRPEPGQRLHNTV